MWGLVIYIRKFNRKCGVQVYILESILESVGFRCLWYWDRMTKSERMGRKRERNSSSFSADITQVSSSLINIHFSFQPSLSISIHIHLYLSQLRGGGKSTPSRIFFLNKLKTAYIRTSNLLEIQRIETATYSNMGYFPGEFFFIFLRIKRFL